MKILMITSETVPFAKTGGLADAVPALADALNLLGHDVRIIMPRYYLVDREQLERIPAPLGVPMGDE
jgi:starch synthase